MVPGARCCESQTALRSRRCAQPLVTKARPLRVVTGFTAIAQRCAAATPAHGPRRCSSSWAHASLQLASMCGGAWPGISQGRQQRERQLRTRRQLACKEPSLRMPRQRRSCTSAAPMRRQTHGARPSAASPLLLRGTASAVQWCRSLCMTPGSATCRRTVNSQRKCGA